VVVAICGVAQAGDGPWAMVILAAHPGGFVRVATTRTRVDRSARARRAGGGRAGRGRLAACGSTSAPDARVDVPSASGADWPRRAFGALGVAQAMPGLHQYWHPHLLGGRAVGGARLGAEEVALDAAAYAEKNWGAAFSDHGGGGKAFPEQDVCVAFAGGRLRLGPVPAAPTAVVVRSGGEFVRAWAALGFHAAAAGDGAWRIRGRSAMHSVLIEGEADASATASCLCRCGAARSGAALAPVLAGRLARHAATGQARALPRRVVARRLEHGTTRPGPATAIVSASAPTRRSKPRSPSTARASRSAADRSTDRRAPR
jgi:hypothetical protein